MNSENTTRILGTDFDILLYSDNIYGFISIRLKNFDA